MIIIHTLLLRTPKPMRESSRWIGEESLRDGGGGRSQDKRKPMVKKQCFVMMLRLMIKLRGNLKGKPREAWWS